MRKKIISLVLSAIFLTVSVSAQRNSWLIKFESIKPFQSTEKDVERILGKPKDRYSIIGEYKIIEGIISVVYSEGKCTRNSATDFDVEKGIVTSFDFRPKGIIKFSSLKLDLKSLTKEESSDVVDGLMYDHLEKGIYYEVLRDRLGYVQFYGGKDFPVRPCSDVFQENLSKPNNQIKVSLKNNK